MREILICEHCGERYPAGSLCACRREEILAGLREAKPRYLWPDGELPEKDEAGVHPVVAGILRKRGIRDNLREFLEAPVNRMLEEKLMNQQEAADRIRRAVETGEKVTIYGDYDADGVTSTALGINILSALGGRVDGYINDRFGEGFGIGVGGVREIHARGTGLIVTADNGIAGHEAIREALRLGMDVVVTDHHEPNGELPPVIVVDPKQPGCGYSNKDLVGAGVLFKVLRQVCLDLGREKLPLKELDLVALGTVADVAPLLGENRVLVKNGLKLMNWEKMRPGIRALREVAGLDKVKSYHLGFVFGPMINAEGRMFGSPETALELLTTQDASRATDCARTLWEHNRKRQELLETQYALAETLLEPEKDIYFLADPRFHEGIVGLIAGRLRENYQRPAIVLGRGEAGTFKGSGRSVPGLNMKELLDKMSALLAGYGGHAQACGLTVREDNLVMLKNFVETEVRNRMKGKEMCREVAVEARLPWESLTMGLAEALEEMEPFGTGFSRPRFLVEDFLADRVAYSRDGRHTRLEKDRISCWRFGVHLESPGPYRLVGVPDINEFQGRRMVQFRIDDCLEEELC